MLLVVVKRGGEHGEGFLLLFWDLVDGNREIEFRSHVPPCALRLRVAQHFAQSRLGLCNPTWVGVL